MKVDNNLVEKENNVLNFIVVFKNLIIKVSKNIEIISVMDYVVYKIDENLKLFKRYDNVRERVVLVDNFESNKEVIKITNFTELKLL